MNKEFEVSAELSALENILKERGSRYGSFVTHAAITQGMKDIAHSGQSWHGMAPDMRESIDMILHKIGRIVNGDPEYIDSWTDIVGYAKLVEKRLQGEQK